VCVPRVNTLGSWSIKLPNTVLNASGVRVPHALGAVLRTQGSGLIVTGPNGVVLTGPMTFASQESTSDAPDGVWTVEGVSDAVILARPTAFPEPSNSDPATQSVSNDVRSGLGEALMRAYVSANIGPTASVARKLTDLTLSADGGLGVSLSKSPRFQNLLELTQEIALGSGLLFDVVQVGAGRQFQVTAPQDVSASVRWDIANNQLSRSKYGYSAPGCTRVFVAGQGEGTDRTIVEVTTAASLLSEAIWGRIERFIDQRNTDDVAELTQAGLELLAAEGTTVTSLEVVPSSDLADGFGSTWFLGSWVTIVVNDTEVRAQIVEVPISITTAGVLVGAVVGDATGFDWESVLSARQQKTESRVSALEQNAEASPPFDSTALLARTSALEAFDTTVKTSGLVPVIPPTFSTVSGTSSRSGATVTFTGASAIRLDSVFTESFSSYRISLKLGGVSTPLAVYFRLRASGVDRSTGNYTHSGLYARDNGSNAPWTSNGSTSWDISRRALSNAIGFTVLEIMDPFLSSSPTAATFVSRGDDASGGLTFSGTAQYYLANSNDGFAIIIPSGALISGNVTVYGFNT
jgi:hypothetical protein